MNKALELYKFYSGPAIPVYKKTRSGTIIEKIRVGNVELTMAEWSKITGNSVNAISKRIRRGADIKEALFRPPGLRLGEKFREELLKLKGRQDIKDRIDLAEERLKLEDKKTPHYEKVLAAMRLWPVNSEEFYEPPEPIYYYTSDD